MQARGRSLVGAGICSASRIAAFCTGELNAHDGPRTNKHRAISHCDAWSPLARLAPQHDTAARRTAASDRADRGISMSDTVNGALIRKRVNSERPARAVTMVNR